MSDELAPQVKATTDDASSGTRRPRRTLSADERRLKKNADLAKWRRRLREPGNEQLLAKYLEKEKFYHKRYVAKRAAAKLEHLTESAGRRDLFTQEVPGILGSRCRTRLFIALCEYGPLSGVDISRYVMAARGGPRDNAVQKLVALGIVSVHMPKHKARTVYYLNPGHPAYRELLAFGQALARRWPSPPRQGRVVDKVAVPLTTLDQLPCNLFTNEVGNRILLIIAVAGCIQLAELSRDAGMIGAPGAVNASLRRFLKLGLIQRADPPVGKGAGKGRARPYSLNPNAFSPELRQLLFTLVATLYDDIAGIARALARTNPRIAAYVTEYDAETAHLSPIV